MFTRLYRHWRLLIDSMLMVLPILAVKLVVNLAGWEFVNVSPLFTSIVAGGVFIVSILLAGTLADYKESEKLPSEIAASLETIFEEGRYVRERHESFPIGPLADVVKRIITAIRADLVRPGPRSALAAVSDLTSFFVEMENLGIPPNYIVRLKQEQSNVRKSLLRIYHIQRTQFVPSAYILLLCVTVLIVGLLTFADVGPRLDSLILVGFVSFLFVYLVKLVRTLDTPFRVDEYTMDDVSLFLLKETNERISTGVAH